MTESLQGYISNIDWLSHDGVNIGMINDVLRNRFYDTILRDNVKDRDCIDIGFGTGLLSMLALQHGARHITAFESDPDRYELGLAIIQKLYLEDRVTLIPQRFSHQLLDRYPQHLVYTETVNGTLWQEGLTGSLPRSPRSGFLPNTYLLHLHCFPVSWDLALGMNQTVPELRPFSPGIDIDPKFIDLVNEFYHVSVSDAGQRDPAPDLELGVTPFDYQIHTAWGWSPYLEIARRQPSAWSGYEISAERCEITTWDVNGSRRRAMDFDQDVITWQIDLPRSVTPVCVAPRAGMRHGSQVLMLDDGHWGPMPFPVLCWGIDRLQVTHDLRTGDINYRQVS